jgi:hypothetical protein
MTPHDMAQAGLWMIHQAILHLIRENGPMQPAQVSDALGLRWTSPEGESVGIAYQIMRQMADTGQLVTEPGLRPSYSIGVPSSQ